MTDDRSTLICVTPVKDEAWILDRFLQCASQWADHIVVADQQSTDGSRAIARRYPKVTLVNNPSTEYDEGARQRLLLREARKLPVEGRRVIIALDADEMLTANWAESAEWERLRAAAPGTVLTFRWVNVAPDLRSGWTPEDDIPFGFVDDGSAHEGEKIHSSRLPRPDGAPTLAMREVKVLHYQYTNWPRMKSKQRWYQCWERLNHPDKRPITIYRQYHHMDADAAQAEPLPEAYLGGYERAGIDMRTVPQKDFYRWDEDIVALLREHGADTFRKIAIWNQDWERLRRTLECPAGPSLRDPRTPFEKGVHAWLARTQPYADNPLVRLGQKLLQPLGW